MKLQVFTALFTYKLACIFFNIHGFDYVNLQKYKRHKRLFNYMQKCFSLNLKKNCDKVFKN